MELELDINELNLATVIYRQSLSMAKLNQHHALSAALLSQNESRREYIKAVDNDNLDDVLKFTQDYNDLEAALTDPELFASPIAGVT